jgi:hypothetical protein
LDNSHYYGLLIDMLLALSLSLLYASLCDVVSEGLCKSREVLIQVYRLMVEASLHVHQEFPFKVNEILFGNILSAIVHSDDSQFRVSCSRTWGSILKIILRSENLALIQQYLTWCLEKFKESLMSLQSIVPDDPEESWRFPSPTQIQGTLSSLQYLAIYSDLLGRLLTRLKLGLVLASPTLESYLKELISVVLSAFSFSILEKSDALKERLWSLFIIASQVITGKGNNEFKNDFI